MPNKFEGITVDDLPDLATALSELRTDRDVRQYDAIKAFVVDLDEKMGDWDFTTGVLLRLQAEIDKLHAFEEENWGAERLGTFLRKLASLNDLTPEGDAARKEFGSLSAIAERASDHILQED